MTYQEAVDFIHDAPGKKQGLDNTRALLAALGNPERDFKALHVAGTNGKGSICAFLHAMLRAAGFKTGLYTSPYLQRYNERVRMNGFPIPDGELAALVTEIAEKDIPATPFELGTALAFLYFSRQKADITIVEVGLGGRLDPTNVLTPLCAVIGNIGRDHVHFLGDDIKEIAREKAGIIKPNIPTILYPQVEEVREVIANICEERGSELTCADALDLSAEGFTVSLPGKHQLKNAATAVAAVKALGLADAEAIREGLQKAWWPGRLEWQGNILMDGAHNEQGALALVDYAQTTTNPANTVLVAGMTKDKDINALAKVLSVLADNIVVTKADNPRALPAEEAAKAFAPYGASVSTAPDTASAIQQAWALNPRHIIVAGSLYLVGEARDALNLNMPNIP